jgi:hypothetical protein
MDYNKSTGPLLAAEKRAGSSETPRESTAQPGHRVSGTAYHEAGHALVALHYGLMVMRVWIAANGDGGTDYIGGDAHLPLHTRFVLRLAGSAATQHFNVPIEDSAPRGDYVEIINLTPDMTEQERGPFITTARAHAAQIIARNAKEIVRLAALVAEKRSVALSEVHPPISVLA